jgi:hypothetical protein
MKTRVAFVVSFISFVLFTVSAFAQRYPFENNFIKGVVIMKDHSLQSGEVKWYPQQTEKLNFRESGKKKVIKYSPEDIAGFVAADTLKFVSLLNLTVYADNYPVFNNFSTIKHTFAHLIDSGRFTIYFVVITRFNAFTRTLGSYPNFLFQDTRDSSGKLIPYPFAIRMLERNYEAAKANLFVMFRDYPAIVEKLRNFTRRDNFLEIVDMIEAVNRQ